MIQLYKNLPTLDLHGMDREYAKILINDFIRDQVKLKNKKIIIIHGIGLGIVKKATHEVLKHHKKVESYKVDSFNIGMTIVFLKEK